MQTIVLRRANLQDAARITEIYNSNPLFLQHHLGRCRVDESFVRNEMEEMERARFSSFPVSFSSICPKAISWGWPM